MAYFTGSWITAPPLPTFSTSAAFAISALAGYNSSASLKGDLDQSSGSESDNMDEHLKIHVDNASDSAASAGFSFWVGVGIGSNTATTGIPTDSTTTNTTTSTVDGQTIITTTDADGNVTTTDADGNPIDPVPTQPELPPDPDANSSASAPKPGRQSASDLIADNPTGIQLAVSTLYSSNVDHDFSFSEKARAVDGYLLHSFSDKNKTTFDGHLTVALGTEETNFEFGSANTSSTNVQAVYDNYVYTEDPESSYLDEPGQLSHTGQLTETYTEATTYAEDFQFALAAEDPVTHTVSLTERFESTSRDLWAGRVFLATELYFNTTDADSEEAPIYRYVESTTGVDGTNIHTFIEETPPYPIAWVDADGNPVNPDEENPGTQPPDGSDPPTTDGADDDSSQMAAYSDGNAADGSSQLGNGGVPTGGTVVTQPNGEQWVYDADGNLFGMIHENGNVVWPLSWPPGFNGSPLDISQSGSTAGTPIVAFGNGLHIAIWGEYDNPLFTDYATNARHAAYTYKKYKPQIRPLTTTLANQSVSHITIRSGVFDDGMWSEVARILRPGGILIVSGTVNGTRSIASQIQAGRVITGWDILHLPKPSMIASFDGNGDFAGLAPGAVFSLIAGPGGVSIPVGAP